MVDQSQAPKKIYCVFQGETKNIVTRKHPINDYDTLLAKIREKFPALKEQQKIRIFYADDEGEVISISYQDDLEEALDIDGKLKLFIASSPQEAAMLIRSDKEDVMQISRVSHAGAISSVDNSIDVMSIKSRKEVSQMAADVFESSQAKPAPAPVQDQSDDKNDDQK